LVRDVLRFAGRAWPRSGRVGRRALPFLAAAGLLGACAPAFAQGVAIPNFWDPRTSVDRPDLPASRTVRFLTDDEFPPLHFAGPDGNPTGFSVELARAACEKLNLSCTIQARRFENLLDALRDRQGDAVAAAVPITPDLRARFTVTLPYFRTPARFAVRKARLAESDPSPKSLDGRSVAVVGQTAHEAYLKTFFPRAGVRSVPDLAAAESAVKSGAADYVFADGLGLALWIGGAGAADCCAFAGGPYLESRFFGEGVGFVFRQEDDALRRAFDYALQQLWNEGKYAEIYLRSFPVSPF
jgi:polar amino acid transport system substrate-binding protein